MFRTKASHDTSRSINLNLQHPLLRQPLRHVKFRFVRIPTSSGQNCVQISYPSAGFDSHFFGKTWNLHVDLEELFFWAFSGKRELFTLFHWEDLTFMVQIPFPTQTRFKFPTPPPPPSTVRRVEVQILGMKGKGLRWYLKSWKNQSES